MSTDPRLDELLDAWEDAVDQGEEVNIARLCRTCPELIGPLKARIAALERIDQKLNSSSNSGQSVNRDESPGSVRVVSEFLDLQKHDQGGLGAVYKARDSQLHRNVAIKFLHQRLSGNSLEREKFRQEAEITGRLDHPGIVPLYAMGMQGNQPFYAMRFIRGDTLDDAIREFHKVKSGLASEQKKLALQKLLNQLIVVCKTIGYAHNRGIIHRDIKPKNIMLGRYGETLVVDWGLAIPFKRDGRFRVVEETTLVPKTGNEREVERRGEGTPVYMSPEQAAGSDRLGPATDIYSLGAVLYRLLTGKFAFDGRTTADIKAAIINGNFDLPRKWDSNLPKPLESICVKAMSLSAADRYATASDFANDLESFLADAPVQAHSDTVNDRIGRTLRRYQTFILPSLAIAALLLAASLLAATRFYNVKNRAMRTLQTARSSQTESLNLTCLMTARSIQYNLEARLMALEQLARDPQLVSALADQESGWLSTAQQQIEKSSRDTRQRLPAACWFLLDRKGNWIAGDNENPITVQQLSHRQQPYFHGQNHPIDEQPSAPPTPLRRAFLSPAFFTGQPRQDEWCSLSVPVFDAEQNVVAVVVMLMPMGQFEPLIESTKIAGDQRFAALVETRGQSKGTLLHHPGIDAAINGNAESLPVCESVLVQLQKIDPNESRPQTILNYVDPIAGSYSGNWNSVATPIRMRNRQNQIIECGWFLLVQDRPLEIE